MYYQKETTFNIFFNVIYMCHLFHNVHIVFPPDLPTFAFNYIGLAKLSTLAENFGQSVRGQTIRAPAVSDPGSDWLATGGSWVKFQPG